MRIGMILDKPFPPDPRVKNEAVSLIEQGHEVYLFCLSYGNEPKTETINQIRVCRYQSSSLTFKLSALAYTFPFYTKIMEKKIFHFLSSNQIEAIHIHDIQIGQAVFIANKKLQLPIVLDLHENRPEIMKFYPHLKQFPGKYLVNPKKWKLKEEEFVNKASKVIVVTEEAKKELVTRTNIVSENIYVVPNTVQKKFYESPEIDMNMENEYLHKFVLLYIGDTGNRRGISTAIDSLHRLKLEIPKILLVIVGSSTNDQNLRQLVEKNGVKEFVDFIGWQDESKFASFIKASDVCISPLHRNPHHDTTFANKIFQYMSLGKPILVSDATAQKNIVDNYKTGLVHKAEDSEDFYEKVMQLYNSKPLRQELGDNGKTFVQEDFYWEKTSNELIKLYSDLDS